MTARVFPLAVSALLISFVTSSLAAEGDGRLSFTQEDDGVTIRINGEMFTRYLTESGPRPALWPVIGPTGKEMTRAYPVADAREGEAVDHIHHRSVWVGYEGINGNDFWQEYEPDRRRLFPPGKQVHQKFTKLQEDGDTVLLVSESDWIDKQGEKQCSDRRTIRFGVDGEQRWFDYQIELIASAGPVEIGDSKEGYFAVRVAPTMRVDKKLGGKIISSRGLTDEEAWSKRAEWVDYHGPVDGERVGIAILSHPSSHDPTPRWHVRTYGLFAANPFGELAFTKPNSPHHERPLHMTLAKGDSVMYRYRVILHRGDEQEAKIAEKFADYAKAE